MLLVFLSKEIKYNYAAWAKPTEFLLRVITAKSGTELSYIIKLIFPKTCASVFVLSKVVNALTHKDSCVPEEASPAETKDPAKITGHNKLSWPEASAESVAIISTRREHVTLREVLRQKLNNQ